MRLRARVDGNQARMVEALRAAGRTVQHLHAVGHGCPDVVVGFRGVNYLLEIKDPAKRPSQKALTVQEAVWHRNWRGSVAVVETSEQALAATEGAK